MELLMLAEERDFMLRSVGPEGGWREEGDEEEEGGIGEWIKGQREESIKR